MIRLLAAALVLVSAAASAQYSNPSTGSKFGNIYAANADRIMSQMIQQAGYQAMRSSIEGQVKRNAAAKGNTAASAPKAYKLSLAATDFKPAGARKVPEQLAETADPKQRGQIVKAGRDILKTIEATPGFRKNNVAAAMTVILGVSIQVLRGVQISDADSQAMMLELNDYLGATPSFVAATAEQRTQMYDTLTLVGGFIAGIAQAGAETNNKEMQEQARAMARDALARFGAKA